MIGNQYRCQIGDPGALPALRAEALAECVHQTMPIRKVPFVRSHSPGRHFLPSFPFPSTPLLSDELYSLNFLGASREGRARRQ